MSDPLQDVMLERARQDSRWGEQDHPDEWFFAILVEEVGETAKAMLEAHFQADYPGAYPDADPGRIQKELVEVCAVALAWLECMEHRRGLAALRGEEAQHE